MSQLMILMMTLPTKVLVLPAVKQRHKRHNFALVCITMLIVTSLLMGQNSIRLKVVIKIQNFPTQFCLGSIFEKVDLVKSGLVSFKESMSNFSVNFNDIDQSFDITNIHKYLIVKKNIN